MKNNRSFPRNGRNVLCNNNNVLRRGAPMWQVVKDEDNFVMWGANVTFLMKIINNIRYNRSFTAKSKQECVNVAIC